MTTRQMRTNWHDEVIIDPRKQTSLREGRTLEKLVTTSSECTKRVRRQGGDRTVGRFISDTISVQQSWPLSSGTVGKATIGRITIWPSSSSASEKGPRELLWIVHRTKRRSCRKCTVQDLPNTSLFYHILATATWTLKGILPRTPGLSSGCGERARVAVAPKLCKKWHSRC